MDNIKDSGSTREFSTGAHRDDATGKGRCDLLPLDQVAIFLDDKVVKEISLFMRDHNKQHIYNALKESLETVKEFENSPYTLLLEVSKIYEAGAIKYGENNWSATCL